MIKLINITIAIALLLLSTKINNVSAANYYISPSGNDSGAGSATQPWSTFNRAWQTIQRGDSLILKDGEYRQQLLPQIPPDNGTTITIKAENDGQAIINGDLTGDGIGDVVTADFLFWAPYNAKRITLEGLVLKNSSGSVIHVDGGFQSTFLTFRRISVYNANADKNVNGIELTQANDNLVEDSIVAGSGRKMILMYKSDRNIIRRNFLHWNRWDGREWCSIGYPYGSNLEIYYGNYNIVENNIGYALTPSYMFGFKSTGGAGTTNTANNNTFVGNIGFYSGKKYDLSLINWSTRPQPNNCNYDSAITEEGNRTGFWIERDGVTQNNIVKDNFMYGNAALGFDLSKWESTTSTFTGNTFTFNTIVENGSDGRCVNGSCTLGGKNIDALKSHLDQLGDTTTNKINNVYISGDELNRIVTSINGPGAQLEKRYNNGVLTSAPLWPWPTEQRIKLELPIHLGSPAITVSSTIYPILLSYGAVSGNTTPVPSTYSTPSPTPPSNNCPKKIIGDADCNNLINLVDFEQWRKEYMGNLNSKIADFDADNLVSLSDFEIWRKGYFGL